MSIGTGAVFLSSSKGAHEATSSASAAGSSRCGVDAAGGICTIVVDRDAR
ncbi:hypothetical protein [Dactylosporangium sp. CA-233914]